MQKSDLRVQLPEEVVERYKIKKGDKVKLTLRRGGITVNSDHDESLVNQLSIWWAVLPAVISGLVFLIYFKMQGTRQLHLTGDWSIATSVIILSVITGFILFSIFFVKSRHAPDNSSSQYIYWRNFPTIVISFTAILALAQIGIFWLLGIVFDGASFDIYTSMMIYCVLNGISNYAMIFAGRLISTRSLTNVLVAVITTGVLISMASNSTERWWQHNLSFLGTSSASNSWQFNITLIFSALLMIALVDLLFVTLQDTFHNSLGLLWLRILLTITALDVGAVGAFPNNAEFHEIHDWFAKILVYLIIVLIVGIRWFLPTRDREFLMTSYVIGVILFLSTLFFQLFGIWSLTAFEIISFILAFGWILFLFRNLQQLIDNETNVFSVQITE